MAADQPCDGPSGVSVLTWVPPKAAVAAEAVDFRRISAGPRSVLEPGCSGRGRSTLGRQDGARPADARRPVRSRCRTRGAGGSAGVQAGTRREPQIRWAPQATPRTMTTSPTEKTLDSGRPAGIANTSPRNPSRGCSRTPELRNSPGVRCSPARSSADCEAGSVPPLSAMVTPLLAAPAATTSSPGIVRFSQTNAPAATYVARCTPESTVWLASGSTEIATTWAARATSTIQVCRKRTSASRRSRPPARAGDSTASRPIRGMITRSVPAAPGAARTSARRRSAGAR